MMKKRMLGMVLAAAMVLGTAPGSIGEANAAAARTRDEAVAWANAQVGNGLDYDGMYGNQCVDLVKYYYDYFGVAKFAKGNANAYADNRLPSGWSRVYGDYQPGDIAVWKTNHKCGTCNTTEYGHVGIITSADSVGFNAVTQNDMNTPYCTQKWYWCSALQCAIRPGYAQNEEPPAFVNQAVHFTDITNAEVYVRVMNKKRHLTQVGCFLYDTNGNLITSYHEDCDYRTNYVNYTCNFISDMGYGLQPGTVYNYVLYAVVDGNTYKDDMRSFSTTN